MSTKMKVILLGAAVIAMTAIVFPTFADTNTNAGNNNSIITGNNSGNSGGNTTATGGTGIGFGGSSDNVNTATALGGSAIQGQLATTGDQSVSVAAQKRNPVSTAFAAPLVAGGSDVCFGSKSVGVQAIGFGLSGGATEVDPSCVRRLDARELRAMGYVSVARALLCQDVNTAKAFKAAGDACPVEATEVVELSPGSSVGIPVVEEYPTGTPDRLKSKW